VSSVPFFLGFFAIVVTFAMLRGGGPERITAVTYILALAAGASVGFLHVPGNFRVVPMGLFIADAGLLIALCLIAIRGNRWWTIPAGGCQLVAVLVHTGKWLNPAMIPNSYEFLTDIWSWPMVILLGCGAWAHRKRLANGIIVPDWKPSSRQQVSPIRSSLQTD
jgi:hypothetical protein